MSIQSIAIIIVSWNTRELLGRCIATAQDSVRHAPFHTEIVVVDNGSTDGSVAFVRGSFHDVTVLDAGQNLGFAGGNNLALRRLLAQPDPPDAMFLLNPDTETLEDAIPRLVAYLNDHPLVDVVGPQLRYPDGSVQSSRRRFPGRMTFFWESTPLAQRYPANPWAKRYRMESHAADQTRPVDWLVGAALLVRRSAIERAGLLDEGFLMYSEELEWQRRIQRSAKAKRQAIVYLPDAVIVHYEGKSSSQVPTWRLVQFQRSRVRDATLTYGQRFGTLFRRALMLDYGIEMLVEAAKWLANHKRPLRAERLVTYRAVIRALRQDD